MDNKNERDEIMELIEEMMKEFGLTETSLRNPINGQIEEADEVTEFLRQIEALPQEGAKA